MLKTVKFLTRKKAKAKNIQKFFKAHKGES
jgi:hypothetical protein